MALTNPELDLLRELLAEDPCAGVYVQVGAALVERRDWSAAYKVLKVGLRGAERPTVAYLTLARAALEVEAYSDALSAVHAVRRSVPSLPSKMRHVEVLALERSGRTEKALVTVARYLEVDPNDVVLLGAMERLETPTPKSGQCARDPFVTVARAEQYVTVGRVDRSIRAYRRILAQHVGDPALTKRLAKLLDAPHQDLMDDLSEDLSDPGQMPPELLPPRPARQELPRPGLRAPTLHPQARRAAGSVGAVPTGFNNAEPEEHSPEPFRGMVELVIDGDLDDLQEPDLRARKGRRR